MAWVCNSCRGSDSCPYGLLTMVRVRKAQACEENNELRVRFLFYYAPEGSILFSVASVVFFFFFFLGVCDMITLERLNQSEPNFHT